MYNIWQDAGHRTRVAFTAARCAINELHKIHSFSFTGQLWCAIFSFNSLWVRLHHKALTELFTNFAEFPAATFVWHYALIIYCLFLAYFAFSSNIKKGSVSCIMLAMACVVVYYCIIEKGLAQFRAMSWVRRTITAWISPISTEAHNAHLFKKWKESGK